MHYSFSENDIAEIEANFSINKNQSILLKKILIKDKENKFEAKNIRLDKNYNLINFKEIEVKTSIDNNINNQFKIINKDKINIKGKIFDAKMLLTELNKDRKNNFK